MMKKQNEIMILLAIALLGPSLKAQENLLQIDGSVTIGNSQNADSKPGTIRWTGSSFEGFNGLLWVSFGPINYTGQVKDTTGIIYKTITIGTQTWMGENLRTTKYRNGDDLPHIISETQWGQLDSGAWVWYGHNANNENIYGKLYNWYASTDSRGLCPEGWHLPSKEEWQILETYANQVNCGALEGNLKEAGFEHWDSPNGSATNELGFTGLPGGIRRTNGGLFSDLGSIGRWWTSTEAFSSTAWAFRLWALDGELFGYDWPKKTGCSIRCLKN